MFFLNVFLCFCVLILASLSIFFEALKKKKKKKLWPLSSKGAGPIKKIFLRLLYI